MTAVPPYPSGHGLLGGRVVVVTASAGTGIGFATAQRCAEEGATVVLSDHHERRLGESRERLAEVAGNEPLAVPCDVTDEDAVQRLFDATVEAHGRIDVLVNNAALYGSLHFVPFEQLDEAEWDAVMNVNVKSIWQCCRAVVPAMKERRSGSIVNVSSLAATYGMPNGLHYTASKAAVIGATRGLARELGRFNIRVNAVAPNIVDTAATNEVFREKLDRALEVTIAQQAIRRRLETGDIVGTVLFLAGDGSRLVTGQTIMVDGGTVML